MFKESRLRMETMRSKIEDRRLVIAGKRALQERGSCWSVPSESSNEVYLVSLSNGDAQCNCSDFRDRQKSCKHIFAVL